MASSDVLVTFEEARRVFGFDPTMLKRAFVQSIGPDGTRRAWLSDLAVGAGIPFYKLAADWRRAELNALAQPSTTNRSKR